MKRMIILCAALIALLPLSAQGSLPDNGLRVEKGTVVAIDDLRFLDTGSSWHVTVEEGNASRLVIESARKKSWISYEDGVLKMSEESSWGADLTRNRAVLTVPRLSADLHSGSSSAIEVLLPLASEDLEISVSSSGEITLQEVTADRLSLKASSSGRMTAKSLTAVRTGVGISSSGRITADELVTEDLATEVGSSGRLLVGRGQALRLESRTSSSGRFIAEGFLVTQSASVRGSSSSRQEFRIDDGIVLSGDLSSSSKLILHGNPSAREVQNISTSSSAQVIID